MASVDGCVVVRDVDAHPPTSTMDPHLDALSKLT